MPAPAAAATATATNAADPLRQAWLDWATTLLQQNRLPWSGDVNEWIEVWAQAVGQVGLVNFNLSGTRDPQMERHIGGRYSYGRQLGRMQDVLAPLVALNEAKLQAKAGKQQVAEFLEMVEDIRKLKLRPLPEVVQDVEAWQKEPDFNQRLDHLLRRLEALRLPPPPPVVAPATTPAPAGTSPPAPPASARRRRRPPAPPPPRR